MMVSDPIYLTIYIQHAAEHTCKLYYPWSYLKRRVSIISMAQVWWSVSLMIPWWASLLINVVANNSSSGQDPGEIQILQMPSHMPSHWHAFFFFFFWPTNWTILCMFSLVATLQGCSCNWFVVVIIILEGSSDVYAYNYHEWSLAHRAWIINDMMLLSFCPSLQDTPKGWGGVGGWLCLLDFFSS